jgi:hypothetical protein
MKTAQPVIALMYDFDKTLCTKDMQEYTFIPNVGMKPGQFWREADELAVKKKMDRVLAYLYVMLDKAQSSKISIHRKDFVRLGRDLEFYPGVREWFERISSFAADAGVKIEHYIISSGLHEIIEGSSINKYFKEVFACEFLYDENDIACWPKNAVNYTTKTQFLFRINKGVLDISDDDDLNKFTPDDERPVPFRNMIYIGDGLTDVPCMKLVKINGGYSIAVYQKNKKSRVEDLLQHQRVDFTVPADYSEGSELDQTVKDIIRKMAIVNALKMRTKEEINKMNRKKQ